MLNFLFTIKDLLIQIVGVGNVILNGNVVLTMLNALPGSYKKIVQGVSSQETPPYLDKLTYKLL
jgi:hypothetical protein